jgi:hypothetical protein
MQNIKEAINLQGYMEIKKKKAPLEILKEWLIKLKSYDLKIVYFAILLLGFGLYTLAYVFLYGFYFGRGSDDIMSIIHVIINPVPFNFKSLTMLGLFLVILLAFFMMVLQRITDSLYKRSKYILLDLLVLIILIICTQMAITLVFIGKYNLSVKYFGVWVFLSLIIICLALILSGKAIEMAYGFMGGILITVITSLAFSKLNINIQIRTEIYSWILLGICLLLAILLVYINLKNLIINCIIYLVTNFYVIKTGEIKFINFSSLLTPIIILIALVAINFLIKKNLYIQNIIIKLNKNKTKEINNSILGNFFKLAIERYKFILVLFSISSVIFYSYFLFFTLGRDISKSMLKTSYDTISYKSNGINTQPEPLRGIIVSHTDNIFYISNENKELIMIKKNTDVEIIPNKISEY